MADVGSILLAARSLIPDSAQVLGIPANLTAAQFVATPTLAAGNYAIAVTAFTGSSSTATWGETTPLFLPNVTVDATHGIQISGAMPVGAVKIRVYYGVTGQTLQFQDFTTLPAQITTTGTVGGEPSANRAYLPDSDGNFIGAYTLYQWLNEGLDKATDLSGGILDVSGVQSINGANMYTCLNKWMKMVDVYFDGFLVYGGGRRQVFRRSPIASISGITVRVTLTPVTIIEMYPQPNRTAAVLSTTQNITTLSGSVTFSVTSGSLLTNFGLVSLGANTANPEIVAYSANANATTLSNLVRGLGGTQPQAWNSGTQVTELNIAFGGARRAVKHVVGDAAKTILVPPGWESLLPRYIEARAREAEHEWKVSADLMKSFESEIKQQQAAYKQLSGPVQISDDYYGGAVDDMFGSGLGGRFAIP